MIPRATYRIQFHRQFTFDDAAALAPWLAAIGISHVYASPILAARPGSQHGYDVVDHARVNEELGGEEGLRRLCAALAGSGLKLIVDIVPNHMAAHCDNAWWLDVLKKGEASSFARYFDIDWHPADPQLDGRILLPALGEPYGEALQNGRLSLALDDDLGTPVIRYYEHRFPVRSDDGREPGAAERPDALGPEEFKAGLALHRLLGQQHYLLCWWRTAADRINWRRFFNINDLISLRIEDFDVFEAVHAKIFSLVAEGLIDGLRIDHVDGLANPDGYCRRLRARLEDIVPDVRVWIAVEKILGTGETLSPDWPVDGTTGYDFLNDVCALLHDPRGEKPLSRAWHDISGRTRTFAEEAQESRREVATRQFAAPLAACARAFRALAGSSTGAADLSQNAISRGLIRLLGEMRAYRTYATGQRPYASLPFEEALSAAEVNTSETDVLALRFIAEVVRGSWQVAGHAAADAVRRFNQLAASVAAKGVEDTAFYRYGRLLSRNDVGCAPEHFSLTREEFHARAVWRAAHSPFGLLATATHDHKRGEDARARLAVLSEIHDAWIFEVRHWLELNASLPGLDPGDAYQLYQTLVGSWPIELAPDDAAALAGFAGRVREWLVKSLREAKLRSSWSEPDTGYEAAGMGYVDAILEPRRSGAFLARLHAFVDRISPAGALNSLVQTTLRCTIPGVPDLYQGAELWDFSLVDPDNRRPVDFQARVSALDGHETLASLIAHWKDGRFKLHVIRALLKLRADLPILFERGGYVPLRAAGPCADHVLAFARVASDGAVLIAVPLHCAQPCLDSGMPSPGVEIWKGTIIESDAVIDTHAWRSLFEPEKTFAMRPHLRCEALFARLPIAVLFSR